MVLIRKQLSQELTHLVGIMKLRDEESIPSDWAEHDWASHG